MESLEPDSPLNQGERTTLKEMSENPARALSVYRRSNSDAVKSFSNLLEYEKTINYSPVEEISSPVLNAHRAVALLGTDKPRELLEIPSFSGDLLKKTENPLAYYLFERAFKILSIRTERDSNKSPNLPHSIIDSIREKYKIGLRGYYDLDSQEMLSKVEIPEDCVDMFSRLIGVMKACHDLDPKSIKDILPFGHLEQWFRKHYFSRGSLDIPGDSSLIVLQIMDQLGFLDETEY